MKNAPALRVLVFLAVASQLILVPSYSQTPQRVITPKIEPEERQLWRKSIMKTVPAEKGCHIAKFPEMTWQTTECVTIPPHPVRRPHQIVSKLVGNGDGRDVAAQSSGTGTITASTGSFTSVIVSSETDQNPNRFSLQINTNFFTTPMCGTRPGCLGWQQFVLKNDDTAKTGWVYMQYWLIGYGACPEGWNPDGNDCWTETKGPPFTPQSIQNLADLVISGRAEANGTDSVTVTSADGSAMNVNGDSFLTLAPQWNTSEFNVFGIQNGSEASLGANTTLVVQNAVEINGSNPTPTFEFASFTGETNSLTLVKPVCTVGSPLFAILYEESNVPNASRTCVQNLCKDAREALAADQKAFADEQQAFKTPRCEGPASFLCTQALKAIGARLVEDEAQVKKNCP